MKLAVSHPPDLSLVREVVRPICQRHRVARLQVFGSVARAEGRHGSDVDFLVEFMPGASVGLLEMGALKEDLEETLGYSVDLLSRSAVEHSRNPYRRQSILADPVTVYGD